MRMMAKARMKKEKEEGESRKSSLKRDGHKL